MIVCFYSGTLQLVIDGEEGLHIFPNAVEMVYLKIAGNWQDGLEIFASNVDEYIDRADSKFHYYKPTMMNRPDQLCIASIGWRTFGEVNRNHYNLPSRGLLESSLVTRNGVPYIKVAPLSTVVTHPRSGPIFFNSGSKDSTQDDGQTKFPKPPIQEQNPPKFLEDKPVVAQVEPPIQQEVKFVRPASLGNKTVEDLRNLSSELTKALTASPDLIITVKDGRLVLEQDVIVYEEF